ALPTLCARCTSACSGSGSGSGSASISGSRGVCSSSIGGGSRRATVLQHFLLAGLLHALAESVQRLGVGVAVVAGDGRRGLGGSSCGAVIIDGGGVGFVL